MNYGIIHNEPAEIYHGSDAVGSHRLNDLNPYPLLFQKRWVTKEIPPQDQTPAMAFGSYFHTLALEGEQAASSRYAVAPKCDRRTKDGKAAYEAFQSKCEGRTIISADDETLAWRMVQSIREKPLAVELLATGKPEVTFRHKLSAFSIQCRADWFNPEPKDAPIIVDVKTIDSIGSFDSHFFKLNYYRQAAFYRLVIAEVLGIQTFQPQLVYIVVEKNEPYQTAVLIPDAQALEIGTKEVMRDLSRLKECYETGIWPGEPNQSRSVSLPEWKTKIT